MFEYWKDIPLDGATVLDSVQSVSDAFVNHKHQDFPFVYGQEIPSSKDIQ